MTTLRLCLLALIIPIVVSQNNQIGCRDEDNNIVDWFYLYKLPKNKFTKNNLIKDGVAYMYITPNTIKKGWTLSGISINATNSMPGLTLHNLYQENNILSLIYNDQSATNSTKTPSKRSINIVDFPDTTDRNDRKVKYKKKTGSGHTKGVVLSDTGNGIWLIHSVPKYPPIPENVNVKYSYPQTAMRYGQSFLCLSLDSRQIEVVGNQLRYNEPKILHSNIPNPLCNQFQNILSVVQNKTVKSPPWFNIVNITTKRGVKFRSFAKSGNFNEDLYEGLVAPNFATDLLVESWRNGPGVLPSNCSFKYKVNNIDKIAFTDNNIAFSSHSDHSKWAVTALDDPNNCQKRCSRDKWICIGDINRAEAQEGRGGGTVCLKNVDIWEYYTKIINSIQKCDGEVIERIIIH